MSTQPEVAGGPWTRHGHAIDGITVTGSGRPRIARCGGPRICSLCAVDAERIRAEHARPATCSCQCHQGHRGSA